jgi:hypothetical protein
MVGEPGQNREANQRSGMKRKRGITIRFGPLGLSLLAAGITAVGFAAISLADSGGNGNGSGSGGNGPQTFEMPAPPGAKAGMAIMGPNLSEADRKKMEEFRQCMEDNGAPAPPDPSEFDPSDGPPKPPSAEDRQKLQQAFEACKDKLPADLQKAGPPQIGTFHCGPAPDEQQKGWNQNQSNQAGA